jgi:hypothetical protein
MAGPKGYVYVDEFGIDEVFDKKYKSSASLKKAMTKAAEKAIDGSPKLTTTPPKKGEDVPQFYLTGTLTKLTKEEEGKKEIIRAKVSMVLGTWPDKSMFGFPSGGAKVPASKRIDDDVEDVAAGAVEGVIKDKVLAELVKRVP